MEKNFLDLKVYTNKRTGQRTVVLPKKELRKPVKKMRVPKKWFK
jgi:hypothetical protein